MNTMQLYMSVPNRINFLQLGRYGKFSEQTYRNNFEKDDFDWFTFNSYLASRILSGKRRAIAIAPSYITNVNLTYFCIINSLLSGKSFGRLL